MAGFIEKFKAWWRGDTVNTVSVRAPARIVEEPKVPVKQEPALPLWEGDRFELLKHLWGEGNAAPTEDEFFGLMYDQLLLNSSNTVLDVGDGLGGAAVHMAKEYKTYIEAYVSNPSYVDAATKFVQGRGVGKHVTVHNYELEHFHLEKRYDVASLRRTLWRVPNVDEFFITIASHLKPGGRIVIADYVAPAALMADDMAAVWFQQEHYQHSLSLDDLKEKLTKAGFQVRVAEDLTASHLAEIKRGLAQLKEFLKGVRVDDAKKEMILREADRWAVRAALMAKGLQFYRIFAQGK